MLTDTLSPLFRDELSAVIRSEFTAMFGCNAQAAMLTANLLYWQGIKEKSTPESRGWVYKTARHLAEELGLTRRGYEKARKAMMAAGILQYRRGGVHGKMHWRLNVAALAERICRINNKPLPEHLGGVHQDRDNFNLPAWVPSALWDRFLSSCGRTLSNKQKKALLQELKLVRDAGMDVAAVMLKTIEKGWKRFVYDDQKSKLKAAAERTRMTEAVKRQQQNADPPPQPPPDPVHAPPGCSTGGISPAQHILASLGVKIGKR